jgi:glycosyl transferase family 25
LQVHGYREDMRSLARSAGRCCFVINLDRSRDRLQAISAQLSAAGIPYRRFPAVEGRSVDPDNARLFDRASYEFRHGKHATANEIACYLSHLGALNAFLDTDAASCVILEDDAIIAPGLGPLLKCLEEKSGEWDMVFLYGNHRAMPLRVANLDRGYDLVGYFARQSGAVAYLVNRRAAEVFVKRLLPMTLPYDLGFNRAWEHGIKIRGVLPFPVTTGEHASDIGEVGGKFPWYRRFGAFAMRGLTETRRAVHYAVVDPIWWTALRYSFKHPRVGRTAEPFPDREAMTDTRRARREHAKSPPNDRGRLAART